MNPVEELMARGSVTTEELIEVFEEFARCDLEPNEREKCGDFHLHKAAQIMVDQLTEHKKLEDDPEVSVGDVWAEKDRLIRNIKLFSDTVNLGAILKARRENPPPGAPIQ